jgi:4'-phosphopantetheinyl transferase
MMYRCAAVMDRPPMTVGSGEVHVWVLGLDRCVGSAASDDRWLDPFERDRAASFRFASDAARYRIAHTVLRRVLSGYLAVPPPDITLRRARCPGCGEAHGRPELADGPRLSFSLSYGTGLVAYAVSTRPVGIDIEMAPVFGSSAAESLDHGLAAALHPREREHLDEIPVAERIRSAYQCIVRKEALLKGLGTGLALDPCGVLVGFDDADSDLCSIARPDWKLVNLDPFSAHVGALAVRSAAPVRVRRHRLGRRAFRRLTG